MSSSGAAEYELAENQLFTDYEQELFTRVVTMAEKEGKKVDLLVVPAVDPFDAMVQTASRLGASAGHRRFGANGPGGTGAPDRQCVGKSARAPAAILARNHLAGRPSMYVNLGPHPPRLWPEDIDLVHELWLQLSRNTGRGCITAISSASLCAAWNVSWRIRNSRWISQATSSTR